MKRNNNVIDLFPNRQGGVRGKTLNFDMLKKHETVELQTMKIVRVNCDRFSTLKSLTTLDLSDNLVSFPFEDLKDLENLTKLILACNNIASYEIPANSFSHLEYLDVSFNEVRVRDLEHLSALKALKTLVLSHCNIVTFPSTEKIGMFSLECLEAEGNALTTEEVSKLEFIPSLKSLNLSNNAITVWPRLCFPNLTSLDLCENLLHSETDIANLSASALLPSLQTLKIAGNRIATDFPSGESILKSKQNTNRNENKMSLIGNETQNRQLKVIGNEPPKKSVFDDFVPMTVKDITSDGKVKKAKVKERKRKQKQIQSTTNTVSKEDLGFFLTHVPVSQNELESEEDEREEYEEESEEAEEAVERAIHSVSSFTADQLDEFFHRYTTNDDEYYNEGSWDYVPIDLLDSFESGETICDSSSLVRTLLELANAIKNSETTDVLNEPNSIRALGKHETKKASEKIHKQKTHSWK